MVENPKDNYRAIIHLFQRVASSLQMTYIFLQRNKHYIYIYIYIYILENR